MPPAVTVMEPMVPVSVRESVAVAVAPVPLTRVVGPPPAIKVLFPGPPLSVACWVIALSIWT